LNVAISNESDESPTDFSDHPTLVAGSDEFFVFRESSSWQPLFGVVLTIAGLFLLRKLIK